MHFYIFNCLSFKLSFYDTNIFYKMFCLLWGLWLFYRPYLWQCLLFITYLKTSRLNCNIFYAVCKERAFNFLYSMAASRYCLFWPPRGQLLRNKSIIPVTNITELVECVKRQFLVTIMWPNLMRWMCSWTDLRSL